MSSRFASRSANPSGHAASQVGGRYAASPLLVDEDIPRQVVSEIVDVTTEFGDELIAVLVELNLTASVDADHVRDMFLNDVLPHAVGRAGLTERPEPLAVSTSYVRCLLRRREISNLLVVDAQIADRRSEAEPGLALRWRTIFRIWPDYVLHPLVDRSASTVKADVAYRAYGADGTGVVWAVADTGIEADHPHFANGTLTDPSVIDLHADFTHFVRDQLRPPQPNARAALTDEDGHGTHVAGIIAGRMPSDCQAVLATLVPGAGDATQSLGLPQWQRRTLDAGRSLSGMAPLARLVSLKVLDSSSGVPRTTSSAVIAALEHVRQVNSWGRLLRIHGVNLSLGCTWHPSDYAAGQSPLCRELDLLVGTGVVAVVSAGNGGYAGAEEVSGPDPRGVLSTITDPANAARAITVGSTHRDRPHTFGVTYASSKGPTLDGRLKPDLLAPGEHITSCAAGEFREQIPVFARAQDRPEADAVTSSLACYAEDSGTSMAAPHVSGAIAAFLSVRPEFIGLPGDIKQLFCETAISLGRDQFFEGHGLVDLMGALSKV
ncbi:S8 family peptidase [Streptomyces nigrescens]|uniref:S8 family peptidase n=1 Tax=Streptomyces nigrescens TaxID=1920 RepID=UPI00224FC481|nr:S8 family peptidase [Streptomyces libani]MCX5450809.1 S8 family peptidase [Streptomyces libani]